jgi:hypothetical protein
LALSCAITFPILQFHSTDLLFADKIPWNWAIREKAVASRLADVSFLFGFMDFLVYKRLKNGLNWTKGNARMHVVYTLVYGDITNSTHIYMFSISF